MKRSLDSEVDLGFSFLSFLPLIIFTFFVPLEPVCPLGLLVKAGLLFSVRVLGFGETGRPSRFKATTGVLSLDSQSFSQPDGWRRLRLCA